jgi:putative MATE family efflux protein
MSTPSPAVTAKFVTGSTLRHVINMTTAASVGLIAVFVVDALNLFYIAQLGHHELAAAVGYAGTLLFFTTSVAIGLSIAASAMTARALGSGNLPSAKAAAGASLLIMGGVSLALTLLLFPLLGPLLALLGAEGETLRLALRFSRMVLPSFVLLGLGMGLSALLRAMGDGQRAMYVTLGAAFATAVLDPLFIFGLGLQLDGVAYANVLARFVMVGMGFYGVLKVHRLFAWPSRKHLVAAFSPFFSIGVPAILTQVATPVGNAFITKAMAAYGDNAVAGWAVVTRLLPVAFGVIFALSGAVGPIIGQNLGAGKFDRIRQTMVDALKVTVVCVLAAWALLALFHNPLGTLFRAQGEAREVIDFFCLFVAGSFLFNGALFVANAAFNNLGFAFYSTALNWGRATLGVIPFVWLGSHWYGAKGVLAGYGLGVVVFGVVGIVLCFKVLDRLEQQAIGPT